MPRVNPIYANPKVLGSPVKILEIRTDKDNPLGYFWVLYSDNTYGPVRIPKDYYLEDKSDELKDEVATQQAIIDNIYKGMSDELIAESQSNAEKALHDYWLSHTDEETEQYRLDLERQALYDILHPKNPGELLAEGLGTVLSLGIKDVERSAAEKFQNAKSFKDYTEAGLEALSPFLFNNAYLGNGLRLLYGGYHLADENGVRKTWNELKQGNWGNAALSATGDLLNAGLAVAGGSGTYDMALDTAAKLGNTSAKAMRFARALNKDIASTSKKDIIGELNRYGAFDTRGVVRTRLGDVEINNPALAYRQISEGGGNNFINTGFAYTPEETENLIGYFNGTFKPTLAQRAGIEPGFTTMRPMYSQGSLWYPPGPGDLIVTSKNLRLGNSKGGVTNSLEKAGKRRISNYKGDVTLDNASVYTYEPGYGYKEITNSHPTVSWLDAITPLNGIIRIVSKDENNKAATLGLLRGIGGDTELIIHISPEELAKVFEDLNGYYFLGHGTGRAGVSPDVIFNNGLRIKYGDASNTTAPVSASNLSAWPHLNSEEVIILPGRADMVKYDFPYGRISTDWYSPKVFSWNDNPGFTGKGLNAVENPHASFVFDGNNAVYTKPESILGVYNTRTLTLRLNPNSQYRFLFGKSLPQQIGELREINGENDVRYFGQPSSRTTTSAPSSVNPLETRLARLRSIPHYPHLILSEDVTPENIRATLRQFAPDLTEDLLDMAVQELMASRRGAYLNIGDDVGNTVSGVGVVDRESAIQYLKNRGILNPTEVDIQNVIAHEHGHSVRVSDEALAEVADFAEPDEFFTRAGQIFDEYGIRDTNIAESPITFNEFMNMLLGYLNRGRLDNGITLLREYLNSLSPVRRSRVMKYINRFAATLPVLLAARKVTNNGESK